MSTTKKSNSKYTEDWLPVKNIANGVIELDNGIKVTGLKIKPKNIFILDNNTRLNTIIMLKSFYDMINFEFWLISSDKTVDISNYLSALQIQYNQTQDLKIRKLISQDIDKANQFMNSNITDTEYFILFKEKSNEKIQKTIGNLMMGLSNAGLESTQTSNADLRNILDSFLNGGTNYTSKVVLPGDF